MKKSAFHKSASRKLALVLMICLLAGMVLGMSAQAVNAAVQQTTYGVLQFNLVYRDDFNNEEAWMTGTCFLINNNTIVTADHCCRLTDEELAAMAEYYGKSVQEVYSRLHFSVTINRDVTLGARMKQQSQEMDFAILQLDSSLQDRSPLVMRHSKTVGQTERVFAVGFPGQTTRVQATNRFTSDDATITDGTVNKVLSVRTWANADFIQSSCKLTNGMSGGPMVDENGRVIGICHGSTGETEAQDDYYYAVCIDQLLSVCDSLGIQYVVGDDPDPTPTEPAPTQPIITNPPTPVDPTQLENMISVASGKLSSAYTKESYEAMQTALDKARRAKDSGDQGQIDSALAELRSAVNGLVEAKQDDGGNKMLIIIIAAAAVVVIIIVVLVIILSSKNKKSSAKTASAPPVAGRPPVGGGFTSGPVTVAPPVNTTNPGGSTSTVPLAGAGETSVLSNSSAGETTVLSVHGGTLIRRKTGDRVEINKAEFMVGREPSRVAYCISDNSSIGRTHVKLTVRDGKTYLADQKSTNGTFVNGVKADPYQEILLKTGDKIKLANEDFEFQA